jgi:hypothetical protein
LVALLEVTTRNLPGWTQANEGNFSVGRAGITEETFLNPRPYQHCYSQIAPNESSKF